MTKGIRIALMGLVIVALLICTVSAEALDPLYEYYITGDDGYSSISAANWGAQTFTPSTAHKITSVKLLLYRGAGDLPGTVTVGIRETDGSGHPTGDDLCSGTTNGNTLPESAPYEWREITLGAGYNLNADTKYAIVVRAPDGDAANVIRWRHDGSDPTYAEGCHEYSDNSGIGWTSFTTRDRMFEEWGEPVVTAPTVTTQACTSVEASTATGNGTITDTGGENCTRRGFCYMVGTSGDPTTANSVAYDDGSFGTGAYTKGLTGLSTGTSYRVRAYAVNSAGTGYGTTVQILTKPAAPTNVQATDGSHTDKVVVTWTKSTGATGYKVYEGVNLLDTLGDVATYDDTAAPAPTITPGTATAGDGEAAHVALSISGQSTSNGASRTYKVVAFNGTGDSADSSTDTGYRGVGSLTYQWYRSAGDSDADYSVLSGATTASHNDTTAPIYTVNAPASVDATPISDIIIRITYSGASITDGVGRYYKCYLSATGATSQYTTNNRGYRDDTIAAANGYEIFSDTVFDGDYSTSEGLDTASPFDDTVAPATHKFYKVKTKSTAGTWSSLSTDYGEATSYGPPSVSTNAATLVEETTATLNGNITSLNDGSCSARGFQWDIDSGAPYANDWSESDSYGTGAFSHNITSLAKGELYYFRAYATNAYGTAYGSELTFLTKPDAPYSLLATATADGVITLTWSKGEGAQKTYIRGEQGSYPTDRTDGYEVYNDTGTTDTDTGLTGGLLYYYRAWSYATEGGKEQYSDAYDEDYSVAIEVPSITTNTPTDIGNTYATLQANMTDTGGSLADYRGFVWDTTTRGDPGNTAPADSDYTNYNTTSGSYDTGAFTHYVATLIEGTPYYVRGCAHNTMGWSYGDEISFSTREEVMYFQPSTMISGTTLPDRAGSNDGTITWGNNPTGVSVEVGGLEATGVPVEISTDEPTPPDYVDDTPAVDMFTETTGENIPVFYPIFKFASDTTGLPIQIFWIVGALVIAIVVGAIAMMFLHSMLIAGFASGAIVVAACSMEVLSWWVLYVYIFMAGCFWVYQKVVSI